MSCQKKQALLKDFDKIAPKNKPPKKTLGKIAALVKSLSGVVSSNNKRNTTAQTLANKTNKLTKEMGGGVAALSSCPSLKQQQLENFGLA